MTGVKSMDKRHIFLIVGMVTLLFVFAGCQSTAQSDLWDLGDRADMPVSKQGSVLEIVSPDEVLVEAYGLYYGEGKSIASQKRDVAEHGTEKALLDARRTAIHVLLLEGSDPILASDQEKAAFQRDKEYFYSPDTLRHYITYEDTLFTSRLLIEDSTGIRVSKRFKVNKERLLEDLAYRRIIVARDVLMESIGNPIIMVMPNAETNQSPLDILAADPIARQSSTIIQSYLTSKGYEVVTPEQSGEIANLITTQQSLNGGYPDFSYQLALTIGSDIYMTFTGYSEESSLDTTRYIATLNIYETTTARLLGSETGYSKGRKGDVGVSVEEAYNDAIDRALTRVMNYWKEDVEKGIQYKVIVSLTPGLDSFDIDTIHLSFLDAVDEIAVNSRELILTDETIDFLIWVDPKRYDRPLRVYQALKEAFEQGGSSAVMGRSSINRKLMQLTIEY
jgi:hypothetical protein